MICDVCGQVFALSFRKKVASNHLLSSWHHVRSLGVINEIASLCIFSASVISNICHASKINIMQQMMLRFLTVLC